MLPDARQAWLSAQQAGWGDPVRLHRPGRLAAQALDRAREVVAGGGRGPAGRGRLHRAPAPHAVATPRSPASPGAGARIGTRIVTTAIDHSSVLAAAAAAGRPRRRRGRRTRVGWTWTPGRPRSRPTGTALAALQVANHEVGTLQPYAEAIAAASAAGVPVVLDATAALGRIDLAGASGWSVLTGWAGAFGGPASVGLLVVRRPGAVAGAVPGRRLPGRPLARRARRTGDLRRRGRAGLLAAVRPRRSASGSARWSTGCARASPSGCPTWTSPATRCAGCRTC